jgi:hypothetical protein
VNDFENFFDYRLSELEVVYGDSRHLMRYTGDPISAGEANRLYRSARLSIAGQASQGGYQVVQEQLEIMRELARTVRGLEFIENIR